MTSVAAGARMLLMVSAAIVAATPGFAGDANHGRVLAARCAACHGPYGTPNSPTIPKLTGQSGMYLFMQLQRFKEGVRLSPVMSPIAESLTSVEMNDVATYFAGLQAPNPPVVPSPVGQPGRNGGAANQENPK